MDTPVNAPQTRPEFVAKMKGMFPEATDAEISAAWDKHSSQTLTERMIATVNDYGAQLVDGMQKEFRANIDKQLALQNQAMVDGIRKGLGLDDNPAIHLKDMDAIVRDLVLKYTPAAGKQNKDNEPDQPGEDGKDNPLDKFDFAARLAKDREAGNGPR